MRGCYMWVLLCLILILCVVQVKSQRSGGSTCLQNEVPCDNSECVARDVWCDGDADCMDRSDEQYCKTKGWFDHVVNDCTEKHFECRNGPCVPVAAKCDGFENCMDGSDENNCDDTIGEFAFDENDYTDGKFMSSEIYFDIVTAETISSEPFQTTSLPAFSNESVDSLSNITESIQRAQQWILEQKDECHGWGEDTPRALIALALISDNYTFKHPEIDLMKTNLASHFSMKFLQMWNKPPISNIGELALYINSLIATCQDPKQFLGHDLTTHLPHESYEEPFYPLVLLTMCLTNNLVDTRHLIKLENFISRLGDRIPKQTDLQLLSMLALLGYREQPVWNRQLEHKVVKAFRKLDRSRRNDGSFGNIYTTALAAQVYMQRAKGHTDASQDLQKTVDYLIRHQKEDGSFGSMLATYYVLPVLKGRSLVDLRNIRCNSIPKHDILPQNGTVSFSLLISGNRRVKSKVIFISYEGNKTFFDIMRMAASMDSTYRFQYEETNFGKTVYSIAGIQNDVETRMSWSLYSQNLQEVMLKDARPMTLLGVGVDRIFAEDGFAYTFLYNRASRIISI